jgi:tetratricopeptide (TPR) repeat protein
VARSNIFSVPRLLRHPLIIATVLLVGCSAQRGSVAVLSDDAPVYSRMSAAGGVTAILHKGKIVRLHQTISAASECWLSITWGSQPLQTGFVRCEDIQEQIPAASSALTAIPAGQQDEIDHLLGLAGIDRYVQTIAGESSLRFLLNTRRLDESDTQVRKVFERALQPTTFYGPIRSGFLPYSSDKRLRWLSAQFSQPLARRVTELVAHANSVGAKRELIPYLTGVRTTPASAFRVELMERVERALSETEALAEVQITLARESLKYQQLDPGQVEHVLNNLRGKKMKEQARVVRIVNLYSYAPLTDEQVEQYTRLVESDNVKWMHKIVQEGVLAGSKTFANEVLAGLAGIPRNLSPVLRTPAEGRTSQELYEQGVRLVDGGKAVEATRFLDAAIKLKPDYAIAYYKRGNAYRDRELASKAISDYTRAINFDPSMTLAYLNRGIAYRFLGQSQRALEDFYLGIQSNSQVAAVWIERAITYNLLEQYTQAVADYTQAIRVTPTDGEAWAWRGMSHGHLQEWQRSWEDCEIGIRLGTRPSELAPVYLCTGRALAQMQDYAGAIAELDRSIELGPGSAVTYQNRGWALEKTARADAALLDYDKAIELDPRDAWTHCQRAKVLDTLGRSEEGQADRAYCSVGQK